MNESTINECRCSRPIQDAGSLCSTCTDGLRDGLRRLGDAETDLEITLTRQDRLGEGGVRGQGHERPLPWSEPASALLRRLDASRRSWSEEVLDGDDGANLADLADMVHVIRMRHSGIGIADAVDDYLSWAERVLDRRPETRYAGPCTSCGVDLYVGLGEEWVTCRDCGEVVSAQARKEWLLAQVADQLRPARDIAEVMESMTGTPVRVKTVMMWASRGRLPAHGHDQRGVALYRVGDVLELANQRRTV